MTDGELPWQIRICDTLEVVEETRRVMTPGIFWCSWVLREEGLNFMFFAGGEISGARFSQGCRVMALAVAR